MITSCLQENLHKALTIVCRGLAQKSTLLILGNVHIIAGLDQITLEATNLEIGIRVRLGAKTTETGAVTIPGRLLADLVAQLPLERVDLRLDTMTLNLRCGRFEQNIKGIDPAEFPIIAAPPEAGAISLEPASLREMIHRAVMSAAKDESRPILTGVLTQFTGSELVMAAADGFRLSVCRSNGLKGIDPDEVIIPARALAELGRVAQGEEPVKVYITPARKQILFALPNVEIVSQVIEGKFPDYTQIVPKGYATRAVVDTARLLKAVRVALLFGRDTANVVRLAIEPGQGELAAGRLTVVGVSAEMGDTAGEMEAAVEGPGLTIAFNGVFLREGLEVMDSPQVILETSTAASPGLLKPVGAEGFQYVIMPMHVDR